jgi:hypothetical protein
MKPYTVIWIEEKTQKALKRAAVDKEISMRELATTILNDWLKEKRNITPPAEKEPPPTKEHQTSTQPANPQQPDGGQTKKRPGE